MRRPLDALIHCCWLAYLYENPSLGNYFKKKSKKKRFDCECSHDEKDGFYSFCFLKKMFCFALIWKCHQSWDSTEISHWDKETIEKGINRSWKLSISVHDFESNRANIHTSNGCIWPLDFIKLPIGINNGKNRRFTNSSLKYKYKWATRCESSI